MGSHDQDLCAGKDIVIFGHWIPHVERMDELLEAFDPVLEYISQNPSSISCFYLLKETKDKDSAAVITVTCFRSKDAYDQYLNSKAKTTLDKTCNEQGLLSKPQREQILEAAAGFQCRSTGVHSAPGIHAAMAKIQYAAGTRSQGIEHWKHVAASVEKTEKEGTHTYWFLTEPENENVLYSLERYKDAAYLWDVHVPSDAIQQNIQKQKDIRTSLDLRVFASIE